MLDAAMEIDKFRQDLRLRGRPEDVISIICKEVHKEILFKVDEVINQHMQEAKEEGVAKGIDEFVEQLRMLKLGSKYEITTDSGQTDFTTPPFPMLPKLLKNAKVAKDGSLYKVIPIKQKQSKKPLTTMEAMKQINNIRRNARAEANAKKDDAGDIDFRTASSKQNASTQWVHPGKDGDMTQKLRDINARMGHAIDSAIQEIMDKHRRDWV